MIIRKSKLNFALFAIVVLVVAGIGIFQVFAAPTNSPGVGSGAIGVDSSNNISVGSSTAGPNGIARLVIFASSTGATDYSLKVLQPNGSTPIFVVANNGNASTTGTFTANSLLGALNGILSAGNVSGGVFAANAVATSSPFAFPNNLGVNTTTQVGLPQPLSVYGGGYFSGSVGVGTTTPGYELDVASNGATTARFGTAGSDTVVIGGGSGKITVGTVDPVYSINGDKFATYGPEMTGIKVETTGVLDLDQAANGEWQKTIDFGSVPKGSDLWLFAQTTNLSRPGLDKLVALLTPSFDGRVWYEKDAANNRLTIYAVPSSNQQPATSYQISYRFTAPRFDWQEWPNTSSDASPGFILNN